MRNGQPNLQLPHQAPPPQYPHPTYSLSSNSSCSLFPSLICCSATQNSKDSHSHCVRLTIMLAKFVFPYVQQTCGQGRGASKPKLRIKQESNIYLLSIQDTEVFTNCIFSSSESLLIIIYKHKHLSIYYLIFADDNFIKRTRQNNIMTKNIFILYM